MEGYVGRDEQIKRDVFPFERNGGMGGGGHRGVISRQRVGDVTVPITVKDRRVEQ